MAREPIEPGGQRLHAGQRPAAAMTVVLSAVALVLVCSMLAGLGRVAAGPTGPDRLSGALLLGSTGVGVLAVLSVVTRTPALRDVALVLVVLSVLVVVVFVGEGVTAEDHEPEDGTGR